MQLHLLERSQRLPISREEAWDFFSSPANLEKITPPHLGFETLSPFEESIYEGQVIRYRIGVLPGIRLSWVTEIKAVDEGKSFIDEQRFGPYRFWHHRHVFEEIPGGVLVSDRVHYAVGFGPFGALAHVLWVRSKLHEIFVFREAAMAEKFGRM